MRAWLYSLGWLAALVVGFGAAQHVQAAAGTTCDNFNGTLGNDTTCTLWGAATDPESDPVYYVFTWGDSTTTRVPQNDGTLPPGMACDVWTPGSTTVPSGTECSADHTYTTVGNPHTAFVTAYDEANHESVASPSVSVFISAAVLSATLTGTPNTSGWYNYTTFEYTAYCVSDSGQTLLECQTEVSIDNGDWSGVQGMPPSCSGQPTCTYNGSYSYPTDGAGYRFRVYAQDTAPPTVYSALVPPSGQVQIDKSAPVALASSPSGNQVAPFVVSATLVDYPNSDTGPNSGVSTWDLQYSINGGGAWSNCLLNIVAGQTSVNFGGGCSPAVTLVPNTTYCFQARARDNTNPTQNQGSYNFDSGTMCTPYQVSSPPIAPHTPSPAVSALVSATGMNLQWYGGDPDSGESLDYSVYISQPNQPVSVPADLDGQLLDQLPCSAQLPQGCQLSYGAPRNRTPAAGQTYQWRVQVTDGFTTVDSTPIPWSLVVNTPPSVTNVQISPATVNLSGTITWQVTDPNDSQSLGFSVYYGPTPGSQATLITSGLTTASCTGGPNSSGWNCTYNWDSACAPEAAGQYVTVVATDGLDSGTGSSAATFSLNHTETKYYPGPGDTNYDSANSGEVKNFTIDEGSIESGSANIRFRGATCGGTTTDPSADANAPGNPASYSGSLNAGATSGNITLADLIPGQSNSLSFTVAGCGVTEYRVQYNLVAACDQPYLSVEEGNIYSQGNIRAQYAPPAGSFNATYLILGGGTNTQPTVIENFVSEAAPPGLVPVNPSFGQLPYPSTTSGLTPQVSAFDYFGLTHKLNGSEVPDGETNSYGHTVQVFTTDLALDDALGATPPALGGQVYWFKGNLTVDQAATFQNGSGAGSGAGLIIVNGDLTISSDMFYQPAVGLSARNLASVGWMVMGNVTVAPSVGQVVGAFYVAGLAPGGTFSTGAGSAQLSIFGAAIARQFQFQRTTSAGGAPSERVVADGRVLLNTPPGFTDVLRTLPTWQFRTP